MQMQFKSQENSTNVYLGNDDSSGWGVKTYESRNANTLLDPSIERVFVFAFVFASNHHKLSKSSLE
jgi:hypothetical protein